MNTFVNIPFAKVRSFIGCCEIEDAFCVFQTDHLRIFLGEDELHYTHKQLRTIRSNNRAFIVRFLNEHASDNPTAIKQILASFDEKERPAIELRQTTDEEDTALEHYAVSSAKATVEATTLWN